MKHNITSIEGGKSNQSELRQQIDEFRKELQNMVEFHELRAELKKKYYDHLIKQGFSDEQALDIVKSDDQV